MSASTNRAPYIQRGSTPADTRVCGVGRSGIPHLAKAPHVAGDGTTLDVLVVEDSAPEALLTAAQLQDAASGGVEVAHQISLPAPPARIAEREPAVVLLDLSLPDAERSGAVRHIKARHPHIPIVVLTG